MTLQAVAAVFGLLLAPITGENLRTLTGGQTPRDHGFSAGKYPLVCSGFSFPLQNVFLKFRPTFCDFSTPSASDRRRPVRAAQHGRALVRTWD